MRNSSISANHRLFIRNYLTDFRRQSSVNDYKLPNTLVCYKKEGEPNFPMFFSFFLLRLF